MIYIIYLGDNTSSKERGIAETILDAVENIDQSVRAEICSKIIVGGRTSLIPGLIDRLESDLKHGMNLLGVGDFIVLLAEEPSEVWSRIFSILFQIWI